MGKVWALKDAGLMVEEIGKDMHAGVERGLLAAGHRLVSHITAVIIPSLPHPPVDRGLYRAGWRVKKEGKYVVVENIAPHAPMIEYGVRAGNVRIGRAMIDALAAWVRRKGIGGRTVVSSSGKTRFVKASATAAQGIAWAIAKSMQKKGIFDQKGLGVLAKAERMIPLFIREEVEREMKHGGHH